MQLTLVLGMHHRESILRSNRFCLDGHSGIKPAFALLPLLLNWRMESASSTKVFILLSSMHLPQHTWDADKDEHWIHLGAGKDSWMLSQYTMKHKSQVCL